MTTHWLLFASLCIPTALLHAQSDQVLTARSAKNTIFLDINEAGKDLRFMSNRTDVDDLQWEYATKEAEKLMLIKDNTYNLRLRLTNPLKYRITVEGNKYEDDEYEKVIQGLADNFQSLLNVLTRSTGNFGSLGSGEDLRSTPLFDPGKSVASSGTAIDLGGVDGIAGIGSTRSKLNGLADRGLRLAITTMHRVKAAAWGEDDPSPESIRSEAIKSSLLRMRSALKKIPMLIY
ncbi:MAG: hypothetical protein IPO90_13220 [Flavobacteriales bacterium]|nr:hypothetical protein [Flavobacteriales bacterium]